MKTIIFVLVLTLCLMGITSAIQPMQLSGINQTALRILDPWLKEKPPSMEMNITANMNTLLMRQPCIYNSRVNAEIIHIGVTIQPSITADRASLTYIIALVMATYVEYVKRGYQGYLRIGFTDDFKRISDIWEVSAWDASEHSQNDTIETAWIIEHLGQHTELIYHNSYENWL